MSTELPYNFALIPLAAVGTGLLIVGLTWPTQWRKVSLLFMLLLVGQASALQLINAPPYAIYQHYSSWSELSKRGPWPVLLLFQAVMCLSLALRLVRFSSFNFRTVLRRLGYMRVAIVVIVIAFMAAVPTISLGRYVGETLFSILVSLIAFLNLLLIAAHAPSDGLRQVDEWIGQRVRCAPHHQDRGTWEHLFLWILATGVTLATGLICLIVFEGIPHIQDAVAYLFQARTYAEGQLYLPSPPEASAFTLAHVVDDGTKWFSKYLPGWPAVLSLGVAVGAPWIVNPILAGLTVILAHALLKRHYEPWVANLVVMLIAVSPWFLFISGSFMSHPSSLAWTLIALLAIELERERMSGAWASLAGVCMGAIFLTRPLEGLLVGPLVALWGLFGHGPRWRMRSLFAFIIAGSLVGAIIFPYNQILTGNAMLTPFALWSNINYGPGVDVIGFGPNVGIRDWPNIDPIPGHGIVDVVLNLNKNMFVTNTDLFGWTVGSLVLALIGLCFWRFRGADFLFLALGALIIFGHSLYWFSGGPDFGARYWYLALIPLLILTVRGIQVLSWERKNRSDHNRFRRVGMAVTAAVVCSLVTFIPWRAMDKYYHYRDIRADAGEIIERNVPSGALVLVESDRVADYEAIFNKNPVDLNSGGTIIATSKGIESRHMLKAMYPGRPVFLLERKTGEPRLNLRALP